MNIDMTALATLLVGTIIAHGIFALNHRLHQLTIDVARIKERLKVQDEASPQ